MKQRLFEQYLDECPIVAILRGITLAEIPAVCDILHEHRINLLEVPLNTPNALEAIALAAKHSEGRQLVGAGTVLTSEQVKLVKVAGGQFIISPNTEAAVIHETVRQEMLSMPGFLTPSEALAALAAGAHYLKLFPAGNFGADYIKNLRAVVKAPIFAVGGVTSQNLAEFLEVCRGVGIGGNLFKPGKSLEAIHRDASLFTQIAARFRESHVKQAH
ncbi:MAG: 2-dehydro-3-deoxy-6-phosphogalactonate aldolase [Victivallales bacterium]|nr:2-dehydro-3-deoxy-6-phosphogalactonate aldolase [Victivallales bacterium]